MTDLRKAAEMALEALRNAEVVYMEQLNAMYALQGALAQPEQEREWVGLTDDEIQLERHKLDPTAGWTYDHFARAIEAKLKEKNT